MADDQLKRLLQGLFSDIAVDVGSGGAAGDAPSDGHPLPCDRNRPGDAPQPRDAHELEKLAARFQAAARLSRVASSILTLDELLPQVVELIRSEFNCYYVGLFLLDQQHQWAVLQAGTGEAGRQMVAEKHKLQVGGPSMIGRCLADAQARIALDVGSEAVRFENPLLPETRSELALPLISRGGPIGALTIQSRVEAAFSVDDIRVLQTMTDQLANAIENARLFSEREQRITALSIVNEIGQALSLVLERDTLFEVVYYQVGRLFDTTNFFIATYEEGSEQWFSAFHVEQGQRQAPAWHSIRAGFTGHIIRHRQLLHFQSIDEILAFEKAHNIPRIGEPACSWLGMPLIAADRIVGVMCIQNYEQDHLYREQDVALFTTVAAQVAIALDNVRLLEQMRRRVAQLNCLSDLGHKVQEAPVIPELLAWTAGRVPAAMQYPGLCRVAIEYEGQTYGAPGAVHLPRQMVQSLQVRGRMAGKVIIAYLEDRQFLDEESALLGDIARRLSGYIENRELIQETQAALAEVEAAQRLYLHREWQSYLQGRDRARRIGFLYDRSQAEASRGVLAIPDLWRPEMQQALTTAAPAMTTSDSGGDGRAALAVPIMLRGQTIGVLGVEDPESTNRWSDEDRALLEAVSQQLALALENARLFEETQRRAERERLVTEITARIRAATDIPGVLQTTATELGRALGTSRALVRLNVEAPAHIAPLSPVQVDEAKE